MANNSIVEQVSITIIANCICIQVSHCTVGLHKLKYLDYSTVNLEVY